MSNIVTVSDSCAIWSNQEEGGNEMKRVLNQQNSEANEALANVL